MATVPFPILRHPDSALKKSLSKSIFYFFWLEPSLSFSLSTELHNRWRFNFDLSESNVEIHKSAGYNHESVIIELPGITSKKWIKHITHVFIQNKRVSLKFGLFGQRSYSKEICEQIGDLKIFSIEFDTFDRSDDPLLNHISSIENVTVKKGNIPKSILTPNFGRLHLHSRRASIDEILISNCSVISTRSEFSDKELNILMKLLIKGSTPRHQEFQFDGWRIEQDRFNKVVLFDGIDYTEKNTANREEFEIKSYDGTQAAVMFYTGGGYSYFEFTPSLL